MTKEALVGNKKNGDVVTASGDILIEYEHVQCGPPDNVIVAARVAMIGSVWVTAAQAAVAAKYGWVITDHHGGLVIISRSRKDRANG